MFSDMSLTEVFLMTLKSQEQKAFTARMLWDLSMRKLWPNDLDMLYTRMMHMMKKDTPMVKK